MPAPKPQPIQRNLYRALQTLLPEGKEIVSNTPIDMYSPGVAQKQTIRPDFYILDTDSESAGTIVPELVVEILLPGKTEPHNLSLYKQNGVKEYWAVDTEKKQVSVYRLQNGKPATHTLFSEGETLRSFLYPTIKLQVNSVFEDTDEMPYSTEVNEPIVEYGQLDINGYYTYWDYLRWQFKERVELIRGKIFKMSPSPNLWHQSASMNLTALFVPVFHKKSCRMFSAPFDVRLPIPHAGKDTTVVQPDLLVVCDAEKLDLKGCNGAPDLVVEILSPGNSRHEMETKFNLYEQSAVKEYWMVDVERKLVLLYTLKGNTYEGLRPFTEGQVIQSPLFPALRINVDEIFYNVD